MAELTPDMQKLLDGPHLAHFVTIMKDGQPIIQNVGQGGILRIDRSAQPKESKNPPVASKTEGGK